MSANTNLNRENAQLRSELAHVVVNYQMKRRQVHEWREKAAEMEALYGRDVPDLIGRLQVAHYSIGQLTGDVMQRDERIDKLIAEKQDNKRSYKANMKRVAKHLKTKLEETNIRYRDKSFRILCGNGKDRLGD